MDKYSILVQILDSIRREAPDSNKRYYPKKTETEKMNNALSRAFIHLYMKVKFGILDFQDRERYITDDSADGGIDAYYIDKENKTIHLIQSKFRTSAKNFEDKLISADEIVKMDADEIVKGNEKDHHGIEYNGKIKQLQREISSTELLGQYKFKIVILANCNLLAAIQKMYKDYVIDIFDFNRSYTELVFPVVSGTYFQAGNLKISINLDNISGGNTRVSYRASTEFGDAEVTLIFAPIREVGAIMSKYRNSILEHNPRSYLGLSKNAVNISIANTVTESTTNEFALFNNGITIIADEAGYADKTGRKSTAHLDLVNPQIINGGQTAYTLCKVYDDVSSGDTNASVFNGKEVLLKIITIDPAAVSKEQRTVLIEQISKATNHQTPVDEADRRSNEAIQIKLQKLFFSKYGLFYERKAGEFFDGLQSEYIDKNMLVDREQLMRVALAKNYQVSETRARVENFFSSEAFKQHPLNEDDIDKYAFGYACFQYLSAELSKSRKAQDRFFESQFGTALRYGRYSVVSVAINKIWTGPDTEPEAAVRAVLEKWPGFESWLKNESHNKKYFSPSKSDWVSYYKGETINKDIESYSFS
ncbi:hypothetical protein [Azospirillum palustre]